jgi:hypothetical protein
MEDSLSHMCHLTMTLLRKARDIHPVAKKQEVLIFGEILSLLGSLGTASTFTISGTTIPSPSCGTVLHLATLVRRVS